MRRRFLDNKHIEETTPPVLVYNFTSPSSKVIDKYFAYSIKKMIDADTGQDLLPLLNADNGFLDIGIGEHKIGILFDEDIINFQHVFAFCDSLISIPDNLFYYYPDADFFNECFSYCSNLTSIPSALFKNNTAATQIEGCFTGCIGLTSIPKGLFNSNTAIVSFNECFYGCYNLASIPEDLFRTNTNAIRFNYCFTGCEKLTSASPTNKGGLKLWQLAGTQGYPYDLYGAGCFRGCIKMSDYSQIPDDWK